QAEDGIRDRNVTGVQTCALPIFIKKLFASSSNNNVTISDIGISLQAVEDCTVIGYIKPAIPSITNRLKLLLPIIFPKTISDSPRSEERRVGKEWRYRESNENATE